MLRVELVEKFRLWLRDTRDDTGEVFSIPKLERRFVSYWDLLDRYPPDPKIKHRKMIGYILQGRMARRSIFRLSRPPTRKSRSR